MPYVSRQPPHRPLLQALDYIEAKDGCTRDAAFAQFRHMASDGVIRALWGDRKPAPPSIGPVTQAVEHIGPYPKDWHEATVQADGRVRFGRKGPVRSILVEWTYFVIAWETHQTKPAVKRQRPTETKLKEWMEQHVTHGMKRADVIKDCRDQTGATCRDAAAAWMRIPDDLRLKRGKRAGLRKIER